MYICIGYGLESSRRPNWRQSMLLWRIHLPRSAGKSDIIKRMTHLFTEQVHSIGHLRFQLVAEERCAPFCPACCSPQCSAPICLYFISLRSKSIHPSLYSSPPLFTFWPVCGRELQMCLHTLRATYVRPVVLKTGSDSPNSLMLMSATRATGSLHLLPLHLSLMKEGEDAGVKPN